MHTEYMLKKKPNITKQRTYRQLKVDGWMNIVLQDE